MVKSKLKVCFVLTAEFAVKAFLLSHLRALSKVYDVTVIVNTSSPNFLNELGVSVKVVPLRISREINLFLDISCFMQLVKIFHQQGYAAVHSITPKAGLLGMLAAWIVRVPMRVHTFTGQVWLTKTGIKRFVLKQIDRLIAFLTTHNIADSASQRQFLIEEKIIPATKAIVFSKGSISGVNIARFKPNFHSRNNIRRELNICEEKIIFLFIGRLTRDKGVLDLAKAFNSFNPKDANLLFVGPDEQNLQNEIKYNTKDCSDSVRFVGHTNVPESYMAAADVLCLPSYREGFGTVVIEAAAVGIPAIVSRIYGLTDAVTEGVTGLLHDPRDINAIKTLMEMVVQNQTLRLKLGAQAQNRAIKDFNSDLLTQAWVDFYQENIH